MSEFDQGSVFGGIADNGAEERRYKLTLQLEPEEDNFITLTYTFRKPTIGSYNRYVKSISQNAHKAAEAFLFDNIVEEDSNRLKKDLEEYPALALSASEKLLAMLGLAKSSNLIKL
ncbi:hypothetical protein LJC32_02695 [Oscillospiraceae bacterium OttesenSCG-928-F05]|nr:hypothetical protein [Oscillospiraceae bacterium OttesenSCG-928-F05]